MSGGRRCASVAGRRRPTSRRSRCSRSTAGSSDLAVDVGRRRRRARRRDLLAGVFGRATAAEQRLLWGVLGGELRQGALDGVMVDAVATAAGVPVAAVRRAHMLSGDLGATATAGVRPAASSALRHGHARARAGRRADARRRRRPTSPTALAATGAASVEWKLDGARIQAHRRDGEVRLFTRNLNDITDRLPRRRRRSSPACPAATSCSTARSLGRDRRRRAAPVPGHDGRLRRRGRRRPRRRAGGLLLRRAPRRRRRPRRRAAVGAPRACSPTIVPAPFRLPSIVTADADEAAAFLDDAVGRRPRGRDGQGPRRRRTRPAGAAASWRKVKPVHTLDLVVLAVEWGHGRRTGWLSNLHLGARGDDGEFVMVGKTFKGLTDELLRWQTERFSSSPSAREDGHVVHVRPEQVVEIALDGVQALDRATRAASPCASPGCALPPRQVAADADRIEALQALL